LYYRAFIFRYPQNKDTFPLPQIILKNERSTVFKKIFLNFRQVFIGATDSALPCALLLDIAKTLQKRISFRDNQVI